MSHTLTIRLTEDLRQWLESVSEQTGLSQGKLIRAQLEELRRRDLKKGFLRLAGSIDGARNLSARKGFSKS
jgi:hypothetical protein